MNNQSTFFSRYGLGIMFVAVFLIPLTLLGSARALKSNKNNVEDWLPANYEETKEFAWFQRHFVGEQFVFLSWEGCTLTDQRLKLFTEKLVPSDPKVRDPKSFFATALTGPMLRDTLMRELNLSNREALARLKGSLIGPDLNQTAAILTLSDAGKANLKAMIKQIEATAAECNIPRATLHMGGPPVDNYAIDSAGEKSLVRLAGIALFIGLIISYLCLRSVRLTLLVFSAGIYSAALSLALTRLLPTDMNAILLTMPSLVFVAGISGAIHLANYYRDLVNEQGLEGAPGKSLHHAALPLGLATSTTAVGLLSLYYSDLVPIKQFGIYSAVGVIASLLLLCLFLPAGFQLWPTTPRKVVHAETGEHAETAWSHFWWRVARFVVDRYALVSVLGIAVMAFFAYGTTKITTSVQLMRMFNSKAPIISDYRWLETKLGDIVPMEVVLKIDPQASQLDLLQRMELVEKVQQRVEDMPQVGSALSAATFAPRLPKPEDFKSSSRGILGALSRVTVGTSKNKYQIARTEYNKRLEASRERLFDQGYLTMETETDADGQKHETGIELWRVSARVSALKDVDFGEFVHDIKAEVQPVLAASEHGGEGISSIYTGLVPLVYKSQRSLLDGLLIGFIMDLVVVTIIMTLCVREWSSGIVLTLPSIFPVFLVFGFMGWMGIVVDTGTVMAPGVALGVTVDDVVHFMLMYRGGLKQGLSRRDSIMVAYKGCARPMFQSWGVIGLGMSAFILSPFGPTQRFGYMMVTLLTAALVGNLIVLPAVLASPLGKLFGRKTRRAGQKAAGHETTAGPHVLEPVATIVRNRSIDEPVVLDAGFRR